MPLFRFILDNPIIIYVILAFGFPVIIKIIKSMKDKRQAIDQRRTLERAQSEALRTGRSSQQFGAPGSDAYAIESRNQIGSQVSMQGSSSAQRPTAPPQYLANVPKQSNVNVQSSSTSNTTAPAGAPRYITLPGGVVLELPPAPANPSQRTNPQRTNPQRVNPQRPNPQRTSQRQSSGQRQQRQQQPDQQSNQQSNQQQRPQPNPSANPQSRPQSSPQQTFPQAMSETSRQARRDETAREDRIRATDDLAREIRNEKTRAESAKAVEDAYSQTDSSGNSGVTRRAAVSVTVGGFVVRPRDWRRAIILREVLDAPVSERSVADREIV